VNRRKAKKKDDIAVFDEIVACCVLFGSNRLNRSKQ
jgi:hypothetical protein